MRGRRLLGSLVGAVLLVAVGTPALGGPPPATDLAIGANRWEMLGEGIANATGLHQTVRRTSKPGRSVDVAVKVINRLDVARSFTLSGTAGDERFSVAYLDAEWNDVTADVVAGTYELSVDATARGYLWIEVTAAETADTGDELAVLVRGTDAADPASLDVVRARVEVPPLTVWGVNYEGTIRCTATFPTRTLRPGFETGVTFRVTNISDGPLDVYGFGHLLFRDQAGIQLWDSAQYWGPIGGPGTLRPGQTKEMYGFDARVRWSGPLTIVPSCGVRRLPMPRVTLGVETPGFSGTDDDAIAAAVAEPGSPFQACPPGPSGEANTGTFETPDGRDLPPLTLRCWAEVRREDGFDVVALSLVSPQDAPDFTLGESSGFPFGEDLPGDANMLAARWSFVVTDTSIRPYLARTQSRAMGEGDGLYDYQLHHGAWTEGGWSICNVWSSSLSPNGEWFILDWITGCSGPATARPERRVTLLPA